MDQRHCHHPRQWLVQICHPVIRRSSCPVIRVSFGDSLSSHPVMRRSSHPVISHYVICLSSHPVCHSACPVIRRSSHPVCLHLLVIRCSSSPVILLSSHPVIRRSSCLVIRRSSHPVICHSVIFLILCVCNFDIRVGTQIRCFMRCCELALIKELTFAFEEQLIVFQ